MTYSHCPLSALLSRPHLDPTDISHRGSSEDSSSSLESISSVLDLGCPKSAISQDQPILIPLNLFSPVGCGCEETMFYFRLAAQESLASQLDSAKNNV